MEDFDYLVPESNAAWLDGRGDGRFERYERFYQSERAIDTAGFDLETTNEGYREWASRQPSRLLSSLSAPWFGRVAVVFFCLYMGCHLVPGLAKAMPEATGGMLLVVFIGLRMFHRRRSRKK
ncbi:hypothetical protein BJG93_33115 (plasmid) [Paraburkholderia sprentiae WSM5005]|uniref:Uncharacterized protein n=1 Tax=Paraburkholderia sprentiae WSM5005 TaxID=754502 RepID=A0A1I9YWQ7_9BURK|nr:hypothetical protein [Paraburkholderia sprentiae]APA90634.1 hypothetical protein BJG93_33115 [Paraburkholderia sprentiae WSM5005]